MNLQTDISDEEFVPFLHSLGVESYKKSFEWMLNDPEFSGVLRWLFNNLDHNNALTAREEYRYAELHKKGRLLPPDELESTVMSIQNQYPGICLPGDKEGMEDVKTDINMQKEKLHLLEKQEKVVKDLVRKNEAIKEELTIELTRLNSAKLQYSEDESTLGDQCLKLAVEVENITESVVDVITDRLGVYGNCHTDKEIAKKFLTFGPLEAYRQSQALYRSHFDLYTAKKFSRQASNNIDEELRIALVEARGLEERLSEAIYSYIDTKADLCGEQAKLDLVANYNHVHPTQVPVELMEAQTSLDLLSQEESILDQQIQTAIKDFVAARTKLAVDTAINSALAVREQILADLDHLLTTSNEALAYDRVLYRALRLELRAVEQVAQFASHLATHVDHTSNAVVSRIESMTDLSVRQEASERALLASDPLSEALSSILGVQSTEAVVLAKTYGELRNRIQGLKGDVEEGYRKKEAALVDFKSALQPLRSYLSDGCTRQPNCSSRAVATLSHSLAHNMAAVEDRVVELGSTFTAVKNGDKQNLRKLWQWFLTDEARLMATMKGVKAEDGRLLPKVTVESFQ